MHWIHLLRIFNIFGWESPRTFLWIYVVFTGSHIFKENNLHHVLLWTMSSSLWGFPRMIILLVSVDLNFIIKLSSFMDFQVHIISTWKLYDCCTKIMWKHHKNFAYIYYINFTLHLHGNDGKEKITIITLL